jgi:hypothetical protein
VFFLLRVLLLLLLFSAIYLSLSSALSSSFFSLIFFLCSYSFCNFIIILLSSRSLLPFHLLLYISSLFSP